jgi:hypothetical protein
VTRDELMAEIERRWRLIDDLVRDSSPEQLERAAAGDEARASGWNVGEVLLHMAGWKRRALESARRLATDPDCADEEINRLQFSDWRQYNDGHAERAAGVPAGEALAEHAAAHADLMAAIAGLPDRCLLLDGEPRFWLRPLLAHVHDHLETDLRPAFAEG